MRFLKLLLLGIIPLFGHQSLAATCIAADYPSLMDCIANDTEIELIADIALEHDQFINIFNVTGLTLLGNGHTITETAQRHHALGHANRHMMAVTWAQDVVIANLVLRSPAAAHADCRNGGPYYRKEPCQGAIGVLYSNAVTLIDLDIAMEKTFHVQIAGSREVVVRDSVFRAAAAFGIWTGYVQNRTLLFQANLFERIGANAIMVAMADNVQVLGNTFRDNHWDTQYLGFGGGQLAFEDSGKGQLSGIIVDGNLLQGGSSTVSMGIELATFSDSPWYSGRITNNRMENHAGPAIKLNQRIAGSGIHALTIATNYLSNNAVYEGSQIETRDHAFLDINANIQQRGDGRLVAGFDGTPKTCSLQGQALCSIQVRWTSSGVANPRVYIRRAAPGARRVLLAWQASGTATLPWVDAAGGIIELISGASQQPLASISVRGVP